MDGTTFCVIVAIMNNLFHIKSVTTCLIHVLVYLLTLILPLRSVELVALAPVNISTTDLMN